MAGFIRGMLSAIVERSYAKQDGFAFREDGRVNSENDRFEMAKARVFERAEALNQTRTAVRNSYVQTWCGSMTDVSNPAVAAHQLAVRGAIPPKVAFMLGAPGAPNGTGALVGLNGLYKG